MKCINCGAEIQPEFKICPYCGTTIQIVPDYSVYDEDNINIIVENVKEPEKKIEKKPELTKEQREERERARERAREKAAEIEKQRKIGIIRSIPKASAGIVPVHYTQADTVCTEAGKYTGGLEAEFRLMKCPGVRVPSRVRRHFRKVGASMCRSGAASTSPKKLCAPSAQAGHRLIYMVSAATADII